MNTNTEKTLPTEEVVSKITLVVSQRVSDGAIGIDAKFNQADSTLLLQAIAYLLDTGFSGSRTNAELVASTVPEVVSKYFDLKEEQEGEATDVNNASIEAKLKESISNELVKEEPDFHEVMKMTSELQKRKVQHGNREGN